MTCEEYRDTVQTCRDRARKAKTHLEWNLARDGEGSKKDFYKYISCKRKTSENVGLLLSGIGDTLTKNTEKAKVLGTFFTLVFTGKSSLQESQAPETCEKVWSKRGRGESSYRTL